MTLAVSPDHAAKRLARLASIQGLYQIALTQRSAADVIKDFREQPNHLLQEAVVGVASIDVDQELFSQIVLGVSENNVSLDHMIAGAFDSKVSSERVEILLRAILRAGAYELHHHSSIPSGVVINDYVDVAHAFFNAREPGLVNAVLDKLSKHLR